MKCQPIVDCLKANKGNNAKVIMLSPRGKTYTQEKAHELTNEGEIVLLCGHYEGIDERVNKYVDEMISIGDYVLTGGELGAMVISDSVIRLLKGAIADESSVDESFENPVFYGKEPFLSILKLDDQYIIRQVQRIGRSFMLQLEKGFVPVPVELIKQNISAVILKIVFDF